MPMTPFIRSARFVLVLAALSLAVLTLSPRIASAEPMGVCVSIVPQKYFLERLAGELVDVSVMVRPGASPATYEPTPRQMAALSKARAYFAIGVPFENVWLDRIAGANPDMEVVHTDQGIERIPMGAHHHHEHEHGEAHEGEGHDEHEHMHEAEGHEKHEHVEEVAEHEEHGHSEHEHAEHVHENGLDPHIWLAPLLVRVQARTICAALIRLDPAHEAVYKANLKQFLKELKDLDAAIRKTLADIPEERRSFMVFHPSWGYFAGAYDLKQIPIESEGKEPGPRELAEIVHKGKEHGVKVVFVQPQFSTRSAKVIAKEMDARVEPLDPLAEDWAANLLHAAKTFGKVLN